MRKINIDKQVVTIPQSWDELTQEQFIFLAGLLFKYAQKEIDFDYLRLMFVCKVLNIQIVAKKKRVPVRNLLMYAWSLLRFKISKLIYKINRDDYIKFRETAKECYLQTEDSEDLLAFNLLQIAKEISFLNADTLDTSFSKNPVPEIKGIGSGKRFDIGLIINTDLTAGTYSDIMDLVIAWEETGNFEILNYVVAMLYTNAPIHQAIKDKKLINKINSLPYSVRYAAYLWFISLSAYFYRHPVYSHLFAGKKAEGDKIRLGMSEVIIRLSKAGYGTIEELRAKNLIEYMDIQVAELQETIRGALAAGVEPLKLAEKTGRTLTQIDQLS